MPARAERLGRRVEATGPADVENSGIDGPRERPAPATPNGTTTRKMLRQPKLPISRPPTVGPIAIARPLQPAQMPSAWPRSASSRHTTRMIASEAGTDSAAPRPASARPAISTPIDGATAHNNEAAVKIATPIVKMRRLP